MRIVILRTNTSDFGKIGTYNVQEVGLANSLIKKGHKVSVLYLNKPTTSIVRDEKYDFVYYLPYKSFGLHGIFDVNILNQFAPDSLILFSDNQLWAKNVINWCKSYEVPCIQYMGAVLSDNNFFLNQLYTKLILLRNRNSYNYSINIAKTKKVQKEMSLHNISVEKVINVGLDESLLKQAENPDYNIRQELGYKKTDKIILYVGRFVDYKRPLFAIDILKQLVNHDENFKLIMIGQGVLDSDLQQYIVDNKVESKVKIINKVPYPEMYKYMVASDVFINLSPKEIFGMAILEAMYYKLPVVANVAPGPNEVVSDSIDGYLLDTTNKSIWAETIIKAISNRIDIGMQSRNTIKSKFTWDSLSEEFLKIFKNK